MADPVQQVLDRGAGRVTRINETTRDRVQSMIADGVANDLTMGQIADSIERYGGPAFDEYRAELISRTELMFAYNTAALGSYGEAGVTMVTAIDGDKDEMCAARNGRDFPVQDAYGIEDHPNGTLDWVPVIGPNFASALPEPESITAPGPATPAQLEQQAKDLVARASRAEPQVTRDLLSIGERENLNLNASFELDGKTLHTLDARLKTEASTLRKVTTEAAENPTLTAEEIGARMKDNLRYTYIAEKEEYNTAVDRAIRELEARGYKPLRATNYWTYEDGYAGLNTNWETADGQLFELQFHTQAGLETKEVLSHPLYERLRVLPVDSPEAAAIQRQIDELWATFRRENLGLGDIPLEDVFPDVRRGPLTFAVRSTADLRGLYAKWAATVTRAEGEAIGDYAAAAYRRINNALRAGRFGEGVVIDQRFYTMQEQIKLIDEAIARARAPRAFEVYRGMSAADLPADLSKMVGRSFVDPAFASSSYDRDMAGKFASWSLEKDETPVVLHIHVNAGDPAALVEGSARTSYGSLMQTDESEVLLPRGSTFTVTGSHRETFSIYGETHEITVLDVRVTST